VCGQLIHLHCLLHTELGAAEILADHRWLGAHPRAGGLRAAVLRGCAARPPGSADLLEASRLGISEAILFISEDKLMILFDFSFSSNVLFAR